MRERIKVNKEIHSAINCHIRWTVTQHFTPAAKCKHSINFKDLMACTHGGGGPREVEVPRLGGVTSLSIQFFFLDRLHMRSEVPHQVGLPGQPGRVTRLAGVSFRHLNAEGAVTRLAGVNSE